MSIQALGWVLENSTTEKGDRLVLLSLANHAHTDGTDAYPSVATIMRETKLPERNVQYALKRLVDGGHIVKMGKAPDERIPGNRRPINYTIVGVPSIAPLADQGCKNEASGVQETAPRGAAHGTQTEDLNRTQTAASKSKKCERCLGATYVDVSTTGSVAVALPCPACNTDADPTDPRYSDNTTDARSGAEILAEMKRKQHEGTGVKVEDVLNPSGAVR